MARGSQFVVDLNVIETECENLKKCYDKYTNNTYSYFKNSYLTKCTDNRIKTAINKISKYYKNVEQDYTAICNWWKSYIDNVKGLEDYLSGKGTSTLSEQSLINYLKGSLEKLQDYNFDIGILYSTVNKQLFSYNVQTNEIKNINNNSSNKNQTYNVDTEIENLNGISNNSSNTKQNYNINNEIRNLDNLSNYQNNDFKTNGISGSFNSVNKNLNANGGTGYNGKFNTNTDEFDFNKNQSGNNNIAGSNIEFDGIENIFTDSNLDVKGQELTFEDVFGSTSKSNNAKVDYSRLVDIDIDNSRLGEFSNNININSRALADDKENFQVNKSSFSLAGGAVLGLGFSNMGKNNSKNNSKNSSSSTSTYTQGSYSSAYTDIDHDNSNLVNEKNLKQNRGYVYSMGMQNIEMHNPNFSFTGIKDLSKKILGLIKTIKTNSIVILETDTIDYKSSEIATAIDETNAKVDTANSIDIINQTETVKTNTTSKPNVFAAAFLNSKIFQDIVGMTTSSINIEDGKTKFDFDTFVDNAYMTAVTNFNEAKENVSKFLGHNPLLKNLEKLGSNAFNSLNVKMSHNNDKKYVESNEHVELGELCEWVGVELSPIAQRKATKELEAANSVIDSYYTRYGDLSELSFKLYSLKKDKDNNFVLSSDDTQELIALILKVNDRSMLSDEENVSELDKQLDVLLTKLCKGNDLTEADAELINNLVGLLCAEKTMDKQIIHQLEIARDQIPYKFIAENSDYAELSDYSEFYNNTATISYDESTASWVVNGKSYNVDDGSFSSVDKLTLCYLYNNGQLTLAEEGELPWSMNQYLNISQYLTEDEVKKYHYLHEKYGVEEADKYLELMEDTLNQRQGLQQAINYLNSLEGDNLAEKAAKLHLSGIGDGIIQFYEGIGNAIGADGVLSVEEYQQMYLLQIMNGQMDVEAFEGSTKTTIDKYQGEYDLTGASLGKFYQSGITVGNMIPSMAVSGLIAPFAPAGWAGATNPVVTKITNSLPQIVSCSLIGLSAGGNAKNQALHDGASREEANFIAFLTGLSEGGLELFLGNIPGLSMASSNTLLGFLREGGEECIQQFADMCIRMYNGEYVSFEQFTEEEVDTFIMSVITSAEMNGGNALISSGSTLVTIPSSDIMNAYHEGGFNGVKELVNERTIDNHISYIEEYEASDTIVANENNNSDNVLEEINDINIDDIQIDEINENFNNNDATLNNNKSEYLFTKLSTLTSDLQTYINSQIANFNQKMIDNKVALKQKLTDLGVNSFSIAEVLIGASAPTVVWPASIIVMTDGLFRLYMNAMYNKGSEHSLFRTNRINHAVEMTPSSLEQLAKVGREMKQVTSSFNSKMMGLGASLTMQLANTFLQLPRTNKNGKEIIYTGITHETVIKMLVELQKQGFIEAVEGNNINNDGLKEIDIKGKKYKVRYLESGIANLIKKGKSYKTTPLIVEKLLLGNFKESIKAFFHRSANSKLEYKFRFKLTDKAFTKEDALNMMGIYNKSLQKSNSNYEIDVLYDKNGSPYIGLQNKVEAIEINEQVAPVETLEDINIDDIIIEEINEKVDHNDINLKDIDINDKNNINSKITEELKKVRNNILAYSEFMAGIGLMGVGFINPLILPSGLVIIVDAATKLNQLFKNMSLTSHSLFQSSKDGSIVMAPNLKQINDGFRLTKKYGANKTFLLQLSNCFLELQRYDSNGNIRTYKGDSHIGTIAQLKKLAKQGFITNLKISERQDGSSLVVEKILLGNGEALKNKKTKMYDFEFELTDKKFTVDDAYTLFDKNYSGIAEIKTDKNGNQYLGFKENIENNNDVINKVEVTEINERVVKNETLENINLDDIILEEINENVTQTEILEEENINNVNQTIDSSIISDELQAKINRLHELEQIDDIEVEFLFDENNHNSLHIEYNKLKRYIDIQLTDEKNYLQNKLKDLIEKQKNSSFPDYFNQDIDKLKEIINSIESKKDQIMNLDGRSVYDLANLTITEANIPQSLLNCAEKNAIEILEKARLVEHQVTEDIQDLAVDSTFLIGEDFKFKDQESLTRKIIDDAAKMTKKDINDLTIEDINVAAKLIGDGLRYTLILDQFAYKGLLEKSLDNLTKKGYEVLNVKNYWNGKHYKGVNVSIETITGFKFELQFHTSDSYKTKECLTHDFYKVKRNDGLNSDIQKLADDIQIAYQSLVEPPTGMIDYVWECKEKIEEINSLFDEANISYISQLSLEKKVYLLSKIDSEQVYDYFTKTISIDEIINSDDFNTVLNLLNLFDNNEMSEIINNQEIKEYLLSNPKIFEYLNSCYNPRVNIFLDKMTSEEILKNFENLTTLLLKDHSDAIEIVLNKMTSEEIIDNLDRIVPLLREDSNEINKKLNLKDLPELMRKNYDSIILDSKYSPVFEQFSMTQKLRYLYYYQEGQITNDSLDILLELYNKNKHIVENLNPIVLCSDLIKLDKEFIKKLAIHKQYIDEYIVIYHNDVLFNKFKFLFSTMLNDNTLETYDAKIKILLKYFSDPKNSQFLINLDIESMNYDQIKILNNYILHEYSSVFHPNLKHDSKFDINVKFENPIQYQQDFYKKCDEMFYMENISNRERCNILLNKYFGLSLNETEYILSMYNTNYNNVVKYETDSSTCSEFLSMLSDIVLMTESELIECYSNMSENYTTFEEIVSIEQEIKQVYARSLNNALYETKREIDYRLSNGRYNSIEYYGKNVKVIDLNGNCDLLIHKYTKMDSGDFYDIWNSNSAYYNHGICCSFINSSKFKTISGGDAIIGFLGFDNKALRFNSCYDIYSSNIDIVSTVEDRGIKVRFAGAEDLIKNTKEYNEVVIEREELREQLRDKNSYIQPDFVIIYDNMEQYEIEKAYDIAIQFDIPVLKIRGN